MHQTVDKSFDKRYSRLQKGLKALERASKGCLLALLTRMAARRGASQPEWSAPTLRVLFLRHDRIGDMILTTGVIHAIARSHPNIELDVLASPANAAVLEKDPLVHQVVRVDVRCPAQYWGLLKHLRRTRYDIVVDCMVFSQSLTTMLLMLATGASHRVGVVKHGKPNVYSMFAPLGGANAHHVEHLAQLAVPFGVAPQDAQQLDIVLTEQERSEAVARWDAGDRQRVLINISVGKPFRQWADANFVEVARHLKARLPDAQVLVLHGPAERQRAQRVAEAAGVARADTPGVRQALAMVATADFVFTPDTSILHAASAFRIPTVTLLTRDHLVRWGLYKTAGEMVASRGNTLDIVPLEKALEAIDRMVPVLSSSRRHLPSPGIPSPGEEVPYLEPEQSPALAASC
ncbi:glycosyltransferase family 9 protein [Geomonas sp.]|uniref:glycosyltransferase family 9 protein n=1 Tax=Geomonas sp. TaxID=2651584 RepID=UPI002B45E011|nr:glycosyltransferase family 9 protein [Geomonas sp.]HJV35450.1 glycosyltransferase family 9 protein [Geomonas sp.]